MTTFNGILTNPNERIRFLRFATVGIMGAVVDFATRGADQRRFSQRLVGAADRRLDEYLAALKAAERSRGDEGAPTWQELLIK